MHAVLEEWYPYSLGIGLTEALTCPALTEAFFSCEKLRMNCTEMWHLLIPHRLDWGPHTFEVVCAVNTGLVFVRLSGIQFRELKACKIRRRITAAYHIERSIANRLGLAEYPCACRRCGGGLVKKVHVVERHHRLYGRDPYLTYLVMVSEKVRKWQSCCL